VAALGHAASVRSTLRVTSRWRAHPEMVDYLQTIVMPRLSARGDVRVLDDLCAVTVEFNPRAASMQLHCPLSSRL
jgi:hypothetical protein